MAAKDSRNGSTPGKGFPIIGVGASAGGLEALQRFLSVLPKDFGFALVFIQHLSAKYKSLLAELLSAKRPSLVIQEISAGLKAQPGRLYLAPPGKEIRLRNGLFQTTVHPEGLIHLPIDEFLASLAEDVAERAIAVIFSGAGTDGARGCRAVRAAGGTVFVQDPATAEFNSMPLAAIATGQADAVLPPEDICRELLKVQGIGTVVVARDYVIAPEEYDAFFRVLLDKTGSRFNHYKKSVVSRRIRRRMYLHGVPTVKDYLDLVIARDAEAASLAADLMIGVTSFFRDRVAWKALNIEVVKKLAGEDTTLPVRVWTPASATGEEAYSITMMLAHELALSGKKREIQVFATDVNDRALEKAREGKYPSSISADVPREYIQKYFTASEDGQALVVSKEIRECVVVAKQDLLTDPPFSRLDLIICRNFMIYLEPEAQEKCISLFHYALKDGGYLFLGNAETVGRQNTHFKSVGRKQCRVYLKIDKSPASRLPLSVPYAAERAARPSLSSSAATGHQPATGIAQEYLLEEFAPAAVAFDQNFEIVYHNGLTHRYLRQPRGIPTHNLLELLPEALRNRIRGAIFRARDEGKPVSIRANVSGDDEKKRQVTLRVSRIKENLYVIVFQEKGGRATKEEAVPLDTWRIEETAIHQLESELSATRQDLQSHIEQLKSLNEELQSSNEELQAANEELETSREELQSLNEELVTVNSQLQTKVEEQDETNNDLNNFLAGTNIPTIFLDQQFRVRRFTPAMLRLVKLLPSDVGRPIVDMSQENLGPELTKEAQTVLDSLVPVKQEIRINGAWYVRTTLPYRTADNRIAGVVVTYNDVTELKVAEERTRHLASFPQFNPSPVLEVNSSGSIIYSNAATQKVLESLGLDEGNANIFLPHDIDSILRNLEKNVEQTLTREVEVADKVFGETIYVAPQFSAVRIYAFDITERRRAERVVMARLRLAEASTRGALPADDVLRLTLDELEVQTGSKIGFFHFLEKDQETLSLQSWSTNTVATMCSAEGKGRHYNISQAGVWVDCVREKRPVIHNDYASLPHKKGMPNGHAPVVREMVVPIFRGGRIVAIIGVGNKDTDYEESDIEIATYLGDFSWEIVERKRAEKALRESEERLGLFIAHAPAALAMFDRDMRYLSVSRRWMSDYGLGDRDLRGMSHYEVFPEIPEAWKAIHRRALAGEVVRSDNDRFDRADGSVQWLQWEVRPWYNAAGAVAGIVVFSEDITKRKQAEALISRLAAIVESADDAIISKDLNGVIQSWNIGAEKMFGYTAAEAVGRNISFLVPPGHVDEVPEIIKQILRDEHIDHFETVRMRKDGAIVPVSLTFSPIKDASGKVIGISKIAHDVTERKRAEEALRLSEEKFALAFANNPAAIAMTRLEDGLFLDVNDTWLALNGYAREEVIGRSARKLPIWPDVESSTRFVQALREKGSIRGWEQEFRRKSGEVFVTQLSAQILTVRGEKVILSTLVDITERKIAEEQLERSNKKVNEILTSIQDDFYVLGRDWNFAYAGRRFTSKIGKEPEDFIGKNIWEMFPDHRGTVLEENFHAAMEKREIRRFETGGKYTNAWYRMTAFPSTEGITVLGTDITERKKAEEALRQSEKQYRELFENMVEGFAYCKMIFENGKPQDFIYLSVNHAFETLTGLTNVVGKSVTEVIPGIRETDQELFEIYGRVALTGKPERFETFIEALKMWFSISVYSPEKEFFVAVFDVITERKQAEAAQLRLNKALKALSDSSQAIIRAADEPEYLYDVCRIVVEDCGYSMAWIGFAENDEAKSVRTAAYAGFEEGYLETLELTWADTKRGRGPTGTAIRTGNVTVCRNMLTDPAFTPWRDEAIKRGYASSIVFPLRADGRVFGAISMYSREADPFTEDEVTLLTELTDNVAYGIEILRIRAAQKKAEEALKESEERARALADSIPNLAWWANGDGYITWYNRRWYEYTGTTPEQMEGWGWQSVHDPNVLPKVLERWKTSIATGEPFDMEFPLRGADGIFRAFLTRVLPLKDSAGRVLRWFGTNTDISALIKSEEALRQSEEKYRSLFENMIDGLAYHRIVIDENGKPVDYVFLEANEAFEKQTGLKRTDVIGKSAREALPGIENDPADWIGTYGKVALTGQSARFELYAAPLGNWYSVSVYSPMKGHFVTIFEDVTERKKAETELLKLSEDMAARNLELESANKEMESFIYSISHDLRAPIRTVAGFAKIIVEDYLDKLDAQGRDYLNRILRGSEKSIQLIDDLLHLSKIARQDMDRVEIDLSSKALKVMEDLRELYQSRNVEVVVQEGLTASADPRLIEIALSNLLENAWKFTSKTTDARIEFGRFVEEGITIYYVKDNGAGFNPEYADKMFWPFHRLHSENEFEGTGIGLAIVERVIRRHGGRVWAKGEVGKGATVFFTLG